MVQNISRLIENVLRVMARVGQSVGIAMARGGQNVMSVKVQVASLVRNAEGKAM